MADTKHHIVLGATGHVGSETVMALLERGEAVTAVVHDPRKAAHLKKKGAHISAVYINDTDALRAIFQTGTHAFLLNPPAAPSIDTDAEEHKTATSIIKALEGSGLRKVVAESTYGAQPGDRIGDLSVLYEFEEGLRAQSIPAKVIRAAYYMSNWQGMSEAAQKSGILPSMYPADLAIPMVAPRDIGELAADLLCGADEDIGIQYVEGPHRYSANDVAQAFASALGKPVAVTVTPKEQWVSTYRKLGFSEEAAFSYARMTVVSVAGDYEMPSNPHRGAITIEEYIAEIVSQASG